MQGFQRLLGKHLGWAVIASELSHVFCCVIPTVVTILSVSANIGLFAVSPDGALNNIHNYMHHYETAIITFSGLMVCLGWVAHHFSVTVDCHDHGCGHPPCTPHKTRNSRILWVATILFLINIAIYFGVHRNVFGIESLGSDIQENHHSEEDDHDHHH